MNTSIKKLLANRELAKDLSQQQIVELFATVEKDKVLSLKKAKDLIDLFCDLCWRLSDILQQKKCFSHLKEALLKMPQKSRGELAKKLMDESINYPQFVLFADELLSSFPLSECKNLKFYPLSWTFSDDYTLISENEYMWRREHSLPCSKTAEGWRRPASLLDLHCFYASLKILHKTGSETYFYIP
jgi:hypothetical protein